MYRGLLQRSTLPVPISSVWHCLMIDAAKTYQRCHATEPQAGYRSADAYASGRRTCMYVFHWHMHLQICSLLGVQWHGIAGTFSQHQSSNSAKPTRWALVMCFFAIILGTYPSDRSRSRAIYCSTDYGRACVFTWIATGF